MNYQNEIIRLLSSGDEAGADKIRRKQAAYLRNHVERKDTPRCYSCPHMAENMRFERKAVYGKIDGKRRKRWIEPFDIWCLKGDMFRVNLNHRRWWGFDRRCPLNPYTHHCSVCGKRMCTALRMCRACKKSRAYL